MINYSSKCNLKYKKSEARLGGRKKKNWVPPPNSSSYVFKRYTRFSTYAASRRGFVKISKLSPDLLFLPAPYQVEVRYKEKNPNYSEFKERTIAHAPLTHTKPHTEREATEKTSEAYKEYGVYTGSVFLLLTHFLPA